MLQPEQIADTTPIAMDDYAWEMLAAIGYTAQRQHAFSDGKLRRGLREELERRGFTVTVRPDADGAQDGSKRIHIA